jgi:aminoglycoside phosphotransferase
MDLGPGVDEGIPARTLSAFDELGAGTPAARVLEDDEPETLPFGYPVRRPPADFEGELYGVPHPLTWDMLQEYPKRGRVHAQSQVYQPNNWLIAKSGPDVHHGELLMLLVLGARGLPVPKVLAWYREPQRGYLLILMQYVQGVRLDTVWSGLQETEQSRILSQLRDIMHQQRTELMAEHAMSLDGTRIRDHLLAGLPIRGPVSQPAFFEALAQTTVTKNTDLTADDDSACLVRLLLRNTPRQFTEPAVLTHGDLVPRNILIGAENRIVAILDWSQAGFYPPGWEFAKACFNPARTQWTDAEVASVLRPYWAELNNLVLLRMLGPCMVCAKDEDCRVNHG